MTKALLAMAEMLTELNCVELMRPGSTPLDPNLVEIDEAVGDAGYVTMNGMANRGRACSMEMAAYLAALRRCFGKGGKVGFIEMDGATIVGLDLLDGAGPRLLDELPKEAFEVPKKIDVNASLAQLGPIAKMGIMREMARVGAKLGEQVKKGRSTS